MEQYWIVREVGRECTVRKGLNGVVVEWFASVRQAQRWIWKQYQKEVEQGAR